MTTIHTRQLKIQSVENVNNTKVRKWYIFCTIECIESWWRNRREGDHWGDLGIDVCITVGWISRRWDVGIWTGLGWLKIETGGGRL